MITSRNSIANKGWAKMHGRRKQQQENNDRLQNLGDEDNRNKGNNGIIQMMWTNVPCCTKYESSLGHKTVYNWVMPYLTALMLTGPEVLKDSENEPINLWSERNLMVFDKMIINV